MWSLCSPSHSLYPEITPHLKKRSLLYSIAGQTLQIQSQPNFCCFFSLSSNNQNAVTLTVWVTGIQTNRGTKSTDCSHRQRAIYSNDHSMIIVVGMLSLRYRHTAELAPGQLVTSSSCSLCKCLRPYSPLLVSLRHPGDKLEVYSKWVYLSSFESLRIFQHNKQLRFKTL